MVKTGDKAISGGIAEVIFDETDEDKCGGRSFVDVTYLRLTASLRKRRTIKREAEQRPSSLVVLMWLN